MMIIIRKYNDTTDKVSTAPILAMVRAMKHIGAIAIYSRTCGDGFIHWMRKDGSLIRSRTGNQLLSIQISPMKHTL